MTSDARPELLVSTDWLAAHLHEPTLRVLDCTATLVTPPQGAGYVASGRDGWSQAHLPGAAYLDLIGDLSAPEPGAPFNLPSEAQMTARLQAAGVNTGDTVVVYGGDYLPAVTRAWWVLKASGVADVRLLDGGLPRWQAEGRPTHRDSPAPRTGNWVAQRAPQWLVERGEVQQALAEQRAVFINALPWTMFVGSAERHYGRPGRLPGSVSVPANRLLRPDGQLVDTATLQQQLERAGAWSHDEAIAYCGAGINASVTVFALALLGHPQPRLYDRSLMEWARDPSLPLEVGEPAAV